jgi:hypothetical protein
MRPVECPYKHIGCDEALTLGALKDHIKGAADNHLWLSLAVIQACQWYSKECGGGRTSDPRWSNPARAFAIGQGDQLSLIPTSRL